MLSKYIGDHWEADTVVGKQGKACLVTLLINKFIQKYMNENTSKNTGLLFEIV